MSGLAAAVMNSWTPAVPVSRIGEDDTAPTSEFQQLLREAFDAEPFVKV